MYGIKVQYNHAKRLLALLWLIRTLDVSYNPSVMLLFFVFKKKINTSACCMECQGIIQLCACGNALLSKQSLNCLQMVHVDANDN